MIQFDNDYIDRLNRTSQGGKFLKAVIVTENYAPLVKKYWVDHEVPLDFQGNTYQPLHMRWDNIKTSQSMPTEGAEIALSNLGGQVAKYIKQLDITGNDVILQLIHLDLLSSLSVYWKRKYKLLASRYDQQTAMFTIGRNLGRNKLPRQVILVDEYPGISTDTPRIL